MKIISMLLIVVFCLYSSVVAYGTEDEIYGLAPIEDEEVQSQHEALQSSFNIESVRAMLQTAMTKISDARQSAHIFEAVRGVVATSKSMYKYNTRKSDELKVFIGTMLSKHTVISDVEFAKEILREWLSIARLNSVDAVYLFAETRYLEIFDVNTLTEAFSQMLTFSIENNIYTETDLLLNSGVETFLLKRRVKYASDIDVKSWIVGSIRTWITNAIKANNISALVMLVDMSDQMMSITQLLPTHLQSFARQAIYAKNEPALRYIVNILKNKWNFLAREDESYWELFYMAIVEDFPSSYFLENIDYAHLPKKETLKAIVQLLLIGMKDNMEAIKAHVDESDLLAITDDVNVSKEEKLSVAASIYQRAKDSGAVDKARLMILLLQDFRFLARFSFEDPDISPYLTEDIVKFMISKTNDSRNGIVLTHLKRWLTNSQSQVSMSLGDSIDKGVIANRLIAELYQRMKVSLGANLTVSYENFASRFNDSNYFNFKGMPVSNVNALKAETKKMFLEILSKEMIDPKSPQKKISNLNHASEFVYLYEKSVLSEAEVSSVLDEWFRECLAHDNQLVLDFLLKKFHHLFRKEGQSKVINLLADADTKGANKSKMLLLQHVVDLKQVTVGDDLAVLAQIVERSVAYGSDDFTTWLIKNVPDVIPRIEHHLKDVKKTLPELIRVSIQQNRGDVVRNYLVRGHYGKILEESQINWAFVAYQAVDKDGAYVGNIDSAMKMVDLGLTDVIYVDFERGTHTKQIAYLTESGYADKIKMIASLVGKDETELRRLAFVQDADIKAKATLTVASEDVEAVTLSQRISSLVSRFSSSCVRLMFRQ